MPYEIPAARNAPPTRGEVINGGVIADSPDEVRKRVREQLMLGATQIKLAARRRRGLRVRSNRRQSIHRGRVQSRGRGGRELGHVCRRPCLHAARHPDGNCGRRQVHRTRPVDGRGDGQADGREGCMAEHPTLPRQRVRQPASKPRKQGPKCFRSLREPTTPTSLAKKYKIKTAWGTDILFDPKMTVDTGCSTCDAGALVHPGRGVEDGDQYQR